MHQGVTALVKMGQLGPRFLGGKESVLEQAGAGKIEGSGSPAGRDCHKLLTARGFTGRVVHEDLTSGCPVLSGQPDAFGVQPSFRAGLAASWGYATSSAQQYPQHSAPPQPQPRDQKPVAELRHHLDVQRDEGSRQTPKEEHRGHRRQGDRQPARPAGQQPGHEPDGANGGDQNRQQRAGLRRGMPGRANYTAVFVM